MQLDANTTFTHDRVICAICAKFFSERILLQFDGVQHGEVGQNIRRDCIPNHACIYYKRISQIT